MNAPFATRILYQYQQRAATFFYERDAGFLIAPLGAGKGAAALTALAELIRDGERRHALVIAPKLVATTVWPLKVTLWPHLAHLRVAVLNGTPERRRALLATAHEREVTAIGVDLIPWLVGELAAFADDHPLLDLLIIDETSRLKNPTGKWSRALLKVAGRFKTRWGLTGTPRPNSSMDLFMPAAIVTDGALWGRAFIPWQKQHFRPVDVVVASVELPDEAMAAYKTMQRQLFAAVEEHAAATGEEVEEHTIEAVSPMVATGKCAQLANGFLYDEGNETPV